jgi:hypothetical protein
MDPFEPFTVIFFLNSVPLRRIRDGYICLRQLIASSAHTVVDTEGDSPSTESMLSESQCQQVMLSKAPCQMSQRRMHQYLQKCYCPGLIQLTCLTPR